MKAALTVWDGRISPVFDVSRQAVLLTIEDGVVVERHCRDLETPTPSQKIHVLEELGVELLVCGAISEPLHRELVDRGIRVIGFVAGELDDVLASLLAGRLPCAEFAMPGCRGASRRMRRRARCQRGRGGGTCQNP